MNFLSHLAVTPAQRHHAKYAKQLQPEAMYSKGTFLFMEKDWLSLAARHEATLQLVPIKQSNIRTLQFSEFSSPYLFPPLPPAEAPEDGGAYQPSPGRGNTTVHRSIALERWPRLSLGLGGSVNQQSYTNQSSTC